MSNPTRHSASDRPWLRRYTKLVAIATLVLIFLGAQVNSHDAGLAVPDWPTSFGVNMFLFHWSNWVGGVFHEHLHRLAASLVGLLTVVLAAWIGMVERRTWVKVLSAIALLSVIAQGVLGGLTVKFLLPAPVSISHALLAQSFLVIMIVIAYSQSKERASRFASESHGEEFPLSSVGLLLVAAVFAQLFLGALMRHTESGLAIPDFPTMAGQWSPFFGQDSVEWVNAWRSDYTFEHGKLLGPVVLSQIWIHFAHRAGALAVSAAALAALVTSYRHRAECPGAWRVMRFIAVLVVVQIGLGVSTVWTVRVPIVASIHVATGAAILGLSTIFTLRALPVRLVLRSPERAAARLKPVST